MYIQTKIEKEKKKTATTTARTYKHSGGKACDISIFVQIFLPSFSPQFGKIVFW